MPRGTRSRQTKALALVNRALAAAEDKLPPGRLDEAERREIALILLAGVEGGETNPNQLAEVALTLATTPIHD